LNLHLKKDYKSGSHKDPNNRMLTDHGSKFGMLLDSHAEGKPHVERKTSAGTVIFENGLAVVPDDTRGKDMAHELMESSPYQYNYHPHREGGTMKRDHQVMWRLSSWKNECRIDGCDNEATVQRLCDTHWSKRWQTGS